MIKNYYFSLVTGEIVEIGSDELKKLFPYQIPLIRQPRSSCTSCYGRGYNFKTKSGIYNPCTCLPKFIDKDNFKSDSISVYLPRVE